MQSVTSRIWTRVTVSISYDDNHYTTSIIVTNKLDNRDTLSQINNGTAIFVNKLRINDWVGKLMKKVLIFYSKTMLNNSLN